MTTIPKDADLMTLINVFTVAPSNQSRLVELRTEVTATFVRTRGVYLLEPSSKPGWNQGHDVCAVA